MVTLLTFRHGITTRLFLAEWMDGACTEHAETAPSDSLRCRCVKTSVKTVLRTAVKTPWKCRVKTSWKFRENFVKKTPLENIVNMQQKPSVEFHDLFTEISTEFS